MQTKDGAYKVYRVAYMYVLDTVLVVLPKCPPTTVISRLVRTNYKQSEAKPMIHLWFVRTKSASIGFQRTLWKKKRVQVSELYDKKWQLV